MKFLPILQRLHMLINLELQNSISHLDYFYRNLLSIRQIINCQLLRSKSKLDKNRLIL
jgi:hypothetical protein